MGSFLADSDLDDDGWDPEKKQRVIDEVFGPKKKDVKPNEISETEMDDPLRVTKVQIYSLLISEQEPVHARELAFKYFDTFGVELEPNHYGYNDVDELLQAMPEKISVRERDGYFVYRAGKDERVADIQSLVSRQMTREQIHAKMMNRRHDWGRVAKPLVKTTTVGKIDFGEPKTSQNEQTAHSSASVPCYAYQMDAANRNRVHAPLPQRTSIDWDTPHPLDVAQRLQARREGVKLQNMLNGVAQQQQRAVNHWMLPLSHQTEPIRSVSQQQIDNGGRLHEYSGHVHGAMNALQSRPQRASIDWDSPHPLDIAQNRQEGVQLQNMLSEPMQQARGQTQPIRSAGQQQIQHYGNVPAAVEASRPTEPAMPRDGVKVQYMRQVLDDVLPLFTDTTAKMALTHKAIELCLQIKLFLNLSPQEVKELDNLIADLE